MTSILENYQFFWGNFLFRHSDLWRLISGNKEEHWAKYQLVTWFYWYETKPLIRRLNPYIIFIEISFQTNLPLSKRGKNQKKTLQAINAKKIIINK